MRMQVAFCNIINPIEVGLGEGLILHLAEGVATLLTRLGFANDFLELTEDEPEYPRDIKNWKDFGLDAAGWSECTPFFKTRNPCL